MTGKETLNPTTLAATAKSGKNGLKLGPQSVNQGGDLRIKEIQVAVVEENVV